MNDLYLESLLEEARSPQNVGSLEEPDLTLSAVNASCGDAVQIDLKFDSDGRIIAIAWHGDGCVISQAAMSVLSEAIKGKNMAEAQQITEKTMLELLGLDQIVMGRRKCLMLGVRGFLSVK